MTLSNRNRTLLAVHVVDNCQAGTVTLIESWYQLLVMVCEPLLASHLDELRNTKSSRGPLGPKGRQQPRTSHMSSAHHVLLMDSPSATR